MHKHAHTRAHAIPKMTKGKKDKCNTWKFKVREREREKDKEREKDRIERKTKG